ncbi:flavin reductase [Saccharibacillus sp. O23]|uniref:flavin reductase family protein n=1 Tax=Saccharibacillus sp. O23 TaxID=2009338 RepID=UPI000B4E258F|nr:flavin reductase family protein [Saccharibacillus sp. O23]OWR31460.1 flavin reductase [Saccharibacillus sp. O23]
MNRFDNLPVNQMHRLLEGGPTLLVATRSFDGIANVMSLSFHMIIENKRGLIGAVIGTDGYSYEALHDTGQCVLAVPTLDMAETIVDIGNCSGRRINKFERFGLTPLLAESVRAPLIAECMVNIECEIFDRRMSGDYDGFVILRALNVWVDPNREERRTLHHNGDGSFHADGEYVDLRDRMQLWNKYRR